MAEPKLPPPIGKIFEDGYWNLNPEHRGNALNSYKPFFGGVDVYTVDQVREIIAAAGVLVVGTAATHPPCTVCGTAYEKHGSYPTCASHPYSPDGRCGHVGIFADGRFTGVPCAGTECRNGCARAAGVKEAAAPQPDESKLPPRPAGYNGPDTDPDSPLERWGRAKRDGLVLLEPMADGYWTPWHIANEMLREAQRNAGVLASDSVPVPPSPAPVVQKQPDSSYPAQPEGQEVTAREAGLLRQARDALRPFANYACVPPCGCHNCEALAVVAAIDEALQEPRA